MHVLPSVDEEEGEVTGAPTKLELVSWREMICRIKEIAVKAKLVENVEGELSSLSSVNYR